jgi:LruC domain-containing protein
MNAPFLRRTGREKAGDHFSGSLLLILALLVFAVSACRKAGGESLPEDQQQGTPDDMQVNSSFTFRTTANVNLNLSALDNNDKPVPNVKISVYTDLPELGGSLMASGVTGATGAWQFSLPVPATLDSLVINTDAIGFVGLQKRAISDNTLNCVLGGKQPRQVTRNSGTNLRQLERKSSFRTAAGSYVTSIGSYNSLGVPNYLVSPNDVIDAALLNDLNAALPEKQPVPTYRPAYLTQTNQTNLVLREEADVWVTFLHEGAGYRNVLCYYTYQENDPPLTTSDIDTLFVAFPNVSFVNSGGGLVSGNKVWLGKFEPGTVVGWALIANGYNGSAVTSGIGIYYSNSNLNPEVNPANKKHCLLLNDLSRDKFILSFEDQNREGTTDNDFNDAIFFVSANPIRAIDMTGIALPTFSSTDADGDGVTDNFDDYPNDASQAFNNYFPAQNTTGTLAFEDNWPSRGDFDFNDLVVDYNINQVTNSQNKVVKIIAQITPKAIGASYHNGFGFQLPIAPSLISSVTGTDIRNPVIIRNPNGTEAGQSKATIIVTEDVYNQLPWPGGGTGVNTTPGAPYMQPKTMTITIDLNTPVLASQLGQPPYNPFIFVNGERSREVHLINQPPTDLANTSLLGTVHDNSQPATGRYYVTAKNLPFAINIAGPFDYPVEKTVVTEAHLKFFQWGNSSGTIYKDWYMPLTNYRNNNKIYKR